ncbi:MAG TPA: protein kinase, partial [Gemmatimonadales bacterium]|nr:protein kinase [Gemmatimonadales bacterium]
MPSPAPPWPTPTTPSRPSPAAFPEGADLNSFRLLPPHPRGPLNSSTSFARLAEALKDRYTLDREIGQGGMATVYLAEDIRHRRKVAVKVLRPELAASLGPDRFLREIEIAARLQHPHILPLLDSGESNGLLYYIMPFIEGESLRARLSSQGQLPIHEAARILREVADALAYAHGQGVVHRDIKPDNILISGRHALVTDFGVAKAVSEATGRNSVTTAGVALGTPSYMSPEQCSADPHTDHRTDIYALGAMGYETLAGRPPFVAPTPQEVLAAHVTRAPEPVERLRPATPAALAALVMRCLAKMPSDRPQTADELLGPLETFTTTSGGITPTTTRPILAIRRGDRRLPLALGAVAVLGLIGWLALRPTHLTPVTLGRQTRVTDAAGLESDPEISPDGRLVAYAAGPYFASHIYVRQVSGGPAIDLTAQLEGRHTRPRWSPDGTELLYVTNEGQHHRVSRVSALGGPARVMTEVTGDEGIASADWSPDGKQVVYDVGSVIRVGEPDKPAIELYKGTDPHSVAWSPDGKRVAFVEGGNRLWHGATGLANNSVSALLSVRTDGSGALDTVAAATAIHLSPSWSPDGKFLLFVSDREGSKDIWRVGLDRGGRHSGVPERLTTGLSAYSVSLAPDGKTLSYGTLARESNIWTLPLSAGQENDDAAKPVTSGSQVIEQLSVSRDGAWIFFDSDRRGNTDIYRMSLTTPGAEPEALTTDPANDFAPRVSPDGRSVVFHSMRSGNRDIWQIGVNGNDPVDLTPTPYNEFSGSWSPDGRTVSYFADSAGNTWLGRTTRGDDGKWTPAPLVLPGTNSAAAFSPDGQRVAVVVSGTVVVYPLPGGPATTVYTAPPGVTITRVLIWTPDGRQILARIREPDGRLT